MIEPMQGLSLIILRLLISSGLLGPADPPTRQAPHPYHVFVEQHARLIEAIQTVESRGDPNAHNATEDAAGILQIRPIMVEEVNRLVGSDRYTMTDRWSAEKSREMFAIYSLRYIAVTLDCSDEGIARRWNGGPRGHKKASTAAYWARVRGAWPQASGACAGRDPSPL